MTALKKVSAFYKAREYARHTARATVYTNRANATTNPTEKARLQQLAANEATRAKQYQ